MMYHNNFVSCIKVNGKVLREKDGQVAIPFDSEYSILLKNLNSVRAQVKITIDGTDATDSWLIIQPNSQIDLERFVKGNLSKGNRFKFIERTSDIEDYRGIGSNDGLIRIEYKFETPILNSYITWVNYPNGQWNSGILRSADITNSMQQSAIHSCNFASETCSSTSKTNNVEGITVAGGESNQSFYNVPDFICGPSEVIVLQLVGRFNNKTISKPITVEQKSICTTCGKRNNPVDKFCSNCGTSLVLFK